MAARADRMGAFDVAVIGAGVVGCATARRFARAGARVLVLEKAVDVLDGASKGNSAILHTGFDAPPGSLERRCMADGYAEYLAIKDAMNLPVLETDAMLVAWTDAEAERLSDLQAQAAENGVVVEPMTAAAIAAREPAIAPAIGGFLIPGEHVIDPWSAPHAYLLDALGHGAVLSRSTELLDAEDDGRLWRLRTTRGAFEAHAIVNCAGLYGDVVDQRLTGDSAFAIKPRKGQFIVFDKAAARLLMTTILPTPTARTKGVVLCRTIYGNLLVGPTAEDQDSRDDASVDRAALEGLRMEAIRMLPALADIDVTATYAGLRPATEQKGYRVRVDAERRQITLGGVRSTGLTSALGLAQHAFGLHQSFANAFPAPEPRDPPWMPNLAEHRPRAVSAPDNGGVVCHCEGVTRADLDAAFGDALAPCGYAGLKRRSRAGMGRCQGYYCAEAIAAYGAERYAAPRVGDG